MSVTKTLPARKAGRRAAAAKPVLAVLPPPALPEPTATVVGSSTDVAPQSLARLIRVEPGLHVLSVGPTGGASNTLEGIALPAIQITSPPSDRFDPVEIMTSWNDTGAWLGNGGGIVVLRSPPGGGNVLITAYAEPGAPPAFPEDIEVRALDRPFVAKERAEADRILSPRKIASDAVVPRDVIVPPPADPREADIQITLHIARQGDRSFPARGWVGNLGRRVQIEAFSISPGSKLSADDIEYKAFGPQGRETRWTNGGKLCGTRGRGLPLTGLAVQVLPHLRDRFDVIYQGAFFDSGVTAPCRNGEPCRPARADDVLEAINLRVVERERP
jgi:hypothetical protein